VCAKIEHTIEVIKRVLGFQKVGYRELAKNRTVWRSPHGVRASSRMKSRPEGGSPFRSEEGNDRCWGGEHATVHGQPRYKREATSLSTAALYVTPTAGTMWI
jgi:hypothetical protein